LLLSSRPVVSGESAARTIHDSGANFFSKASLFSSLHAVPGRTFRLQSLVLAPMLLAASVCLSQSTSAMQELPEAPSSTAGQDSAPASRAALLDMAKAAGDDALPQAPAQQPSPPPEQQSTPPPASTTPAPPSQQAPSTGSNVSPDLKGQTELGKQQLAKQEKQRVLGVIPAFNSVYEGTVPPLTPSQKMKLMWKSTTDVYVFAFAAVTAGIGQAQNSHAA